MIHRIRQFVLLLGVCAYVLSVVWGSGDTVICYSADGSLAIEPAHHECCLHHDRNAPAHPRASSGGYTSLSNTDNACCTDIPIADSETDKISINPGQGSPSATLANNLPTFTPPTRLDMTRPGVNSLNLHTSNILSTVVLLI